MKTAETKYFMGYTEDLSLYHDRGGSSAGALTTNQAACVFNPWYYITKGDTVSNRDGDEIYPRGMSLRFLYNAETGRANQFVRVIIAVIPKVVSGTIMDGTNFDLLDAGGSNDTVTGMIKKEGVKVLYDKTYTLAPGALKTAAEVGESRLFKKLYIKTKRGGKVKWQQDGSLANNPVGVWIVPYDNYSTLRTSALGRLSLTYKLYFKDV